MDNNYTPADQSNLSESSLGINGENLNKNNLEGNEESYGSKKIIKKTIIILVVSLIALVFISGGLFFLLGDREVKTCLEQNGKICLSYETCTEWIKASDSERCCKFDCALLVETMDLGDVPSIFDIDQEIFDLDFICKQAIPFKIYWKSLMDDGGLNEHWYKETRDKIYYKYTTNFLPHEYSLIIYDKSTDREETYEQWLDECLYYQQDQSEVFGLTRLFSIGFSTFGEVLFGEKGEKYSPSYEEEGGPRTRQDYFNWYEEQWGYGWAKLYRGEFNESQVNNISCTTSFMDMWCINKEYCIELTYFNIKELSREFGDDVFNPPLDCKVWSG
jgi:hypothetical protein